MHKSKGGVFIIAFYELNDLVRGGIVNKKKNFIILVILMLMSVFIFRLSSENNLLKNRQGGIIQGNILRVQIAISYAQEDLDNNDVSISNLYRDYWKFNEYSMLDLPRGGILGYLMNIRNDFDELIKLRENKLSQQEIDMVKIRLQSQLSKLQEALSLINKECENESINYYLLNSNDNETIQNVINILLEWDNSSDKNNE